MGRVKSRPGGGGGGGGLEIPDFAALPQLDQCLGRIEDILWSAEDGQSKSRPCGWGWVLEIPDFAALPHLDQCLGR